MPAKSKNRSQMNMVGPLLIVACGGFAVVSGLVSTGNDFMRGLALGIGIGAVLLGLSLLNKK